MGRLWCQADPTLIIDAQAHHLVLRSPIEILDSVIGVAIEIVVSSRTTVKIPEGQANRKVFGVRPSLNVIKKLDDGFVLEVRVDADQDLEIIAEWMDHEDGASLFGAGRTNEWISLESLTITGAG